MNFAIKVIQGKNKGNILILRRFLWKYYFCYKKLRLCVVSKTREIETLSLNHETENVKILIINKDFLNKFCILRKTLKSGGGRGNLFSGHCSE